MSPSSVSSPTHNSSNLLLPTPESDSPPPPPSTAATTVSVGSHLLNDLVSDAAYFITGGGRLEIGSKRSRKKTAFYLPNDTPELKQTKAAKSSITKVTEAVKVEKKVKHAIKKSKKAKAKILKPVIRNISSTTKSKDKSVEPTIKYEKISKSRRSLNETNDKGEKIQKEVVKATNLKKEDEQEILHFSPSVGTLDEKSLQFFNSYLEVDKVNHDIGTRNLFSKELKDFINNPKKNGINMYGEDTGIVQSRNFIENYKSKYLDYFENTSNPVIRIDSIVPTFKSENVLMISAKDEELDPLHEVGKIMKDFALLYFPRQKFLEIYNPENPKNCLLGLYSQSIVNKDFNSVLKCVSMFNFMMKSLTFDSNYSKYLLKEKPSYSREAIHDILCQVYSRSVSPLSKTLRKYKAFSNEVYGEILPNLCSKMLQEVDADHTKNFIDLGSGVGNCTIQAALEFGCDSYGVEIMESASKACEIQVEEFQARSKFFGLNHGKVQFFLNQSFVDNEEVKEIVKDLDIVLVNNYIFSKDLNDKVCLLLAQLKDGAKIISLKDFTATGLTLTSQNAGTIVPKLTVKEYKFGGDSVSWTSTGGVYYISTVGKYRTESFRDHQQFRTRNQKEALRV